MKPAPDEFDKAISRLNLTSGDCVDEITEDDLDDDYLNNLIASIPPLDTPFMNLARAGKFRKAR